MAKIARAETTIVLDLPDGNSFVDLAECLSILNRRKYEQGRMYHISKMSLMVNTPTTVSGDYVNCLSATAPNTWVTANAWYKAKKIWQEMRNQVLADNPSLKSKWDDFKVYLNNDHFTAGQTSNVTPLSTKEGEWNMATMTLPDWSVGDTAKEFDIGLCDANAGSVAGGNLTYGGIIYNYAESRARVDTNQPLTGDPADSWGIRVLDIGGQESELTDQIVGENDNPPYDVDDYPGTNANNILQLHPGVAVNNYNLVTNQSGFYVPCGLLKIAIGQNSAQSAGDLGPVLTLTMTPGTYQGVHAPTMRQ